MKSPKGILVAAIVLFGSLFFAFTNSRNNNNITITQKQKLLSEVGNLLEKQHYSPKKIDDNFSKEIFKKYFEELDGDKTIFLKSDIESLKKYETYLDDEIHGADLKFTPAVNIIYDKRIDEAITMYKSILAKPFDFTTDETFITDKTKINYPTTDAERKDRWRRKLKYMVLERYADLIEQRSKSSVDSIKSKTNEQLEKEARDIVLKGNNKLYGRIKVKFTDDERFNTYINVITNLMDPHTDYFPPVEKRAFDESLNGSFFGIGAQLQEQDGTIKIAAIITGGPAWKDGHLMVNDIILKVAQGNEPPVDIAGYDITDAVKLIRGDKGTEVRLTVKKQDGTIKIISLKRDEIVQDEGFARSVIVNNGNDKIGYIYLPDFYFNYENINGHRCSEDVAKEVEKLKAENVKGIVLDLRFNGGGGLYEVVQMVGMFVGKGPVVQVRDKEGKVQVLEARDNKIIYDGPLAVMVNEGSASASEIFAAAIQDYKRGLIIGSTSTYGKGTVQKNVSLGKPIDFYSGRTEFGAVKLTFQKFYRVNGGSTQLRGVKSDVIIPDIYEYQKFREKDNPSALPWDEIAKASIAKWNGNVNLETITKQENERLSTDNTFKSIDKDALWISKNAETPINLNLEKYQQQQKELKATAERLNSLLKLKNEMDVQVMNEDKDKFYNNPDKIKGERYLAWLKDKKTDLYLNQAARIVSEMIHAQVQTVAK
ncbi:MAG: carboxy terminal-processing peptidase [Bacteroidetes bacterium]|nr:carboxy terminal-processing peptidase [Bacteroidota bacterium]MBS1649665.1 carboxy terminal-processing peptidase [Bacteroidota bacterium]